MSPQSRTNSSESGLAGPVTDGSGLPAASIIGFGTSHDAGLCVVNAATGHPTFAASSERLTRKKSDWRPGIDLLPWAEKELGHNLSPFLSLPLADDATYCLENGWYGFECSPHVLFLCYRWTAPEARIEIPADEDCDQICLHVLPVKSCQHQFAATVYLNGQEVARLHNRKAEWKFSLPDKSSIREVRIVAQKPFKAPDPDPRTMGILVTSVVARRRNPQAILPTMAGDSLPVGQLTRRYFTKLVFLRMRGIRPPIHREFARTVLRYYRIATGRHQSFAHMVLQPFPVRPTYDHHLCHCASAYYPSGANKALVVSLDGIGDEYSCRVCRAEDGVLQTLATYYYEELPIGLNYEAITRLLGFSPLRHAGKVTGLAAYGKENLECRIALDTFFAEMWRRGGDCDFAYERLVRDTRSDVRPKRVRQEVFGRFSREDIAYAIQKRTEQQIAELIAQYKSQHPDLHDICLAGGVFANVRVNQVVHQLGFRNIFIQPAMSDAGLAFGAALLSCVEQNGGRLQPYRLEHVFLGPGWSNDEIAAQMQQHGVEGELIAETDIGERIAQLLAQKKVVAHYHGRMEFGPRALGNRSILYSAADPDVNRWLNEQLNRTEFMPFAPAVMWEHADEFFLGLGGARHTAEFMTITCDCTDRAKQEIPAAVHVDGTARPQLVHVDRNPRFHSILSAYHTITGTPVVINTSFNMHEEPIVASPYDAIRAFQLGRLDALVLGNYLILK